MFKHYTDIKVGDKIILSSKESYTVAEIELDGKRIIGTDGVYYHYGMVQVAVYVKDDENVMKDKKQFIQAIIQSDKQRTQDSFIDLAEYTILNLQEAIESVKRGKNINSCGVLQTSAQRIDMLAAELGTIEKMIGYFVEKEK